MRRSMRFIAPAVLLLVLSAAVYLAAQPGPFGAQIETALRAYGISVNYHTFGSPPTLGANGFGFRNNAGSMEVKDSGGAWTGITAGLGAAPADAQYLVAAADATLTAEVVITDSASFAAVLTDETGSGGGFVRATSPTLTTPAIGAATGTSLVLTGNLSAEDLLIEDSNASHYLTITTTSDLTVARTLTLVPGDADRTVTLSGNPTLADWFDQAVKAASAVTFATVDTGQGANELYDMDQNVLIASDVQFNTLTVATEVYDATGWDADNTVPTKDAVRDKIEALGTGAPTGATYITQTPDGTLSAEQALSALASGIMRVATTTGVVTSLTDSAGIAANLSDETGSGLLVFGTTPTITFANTGLTVQDTVGGELLTIKPGSDLSVARTLEIVTGDAARTVTLNGNPTLNDWFDQSVKAAATPTFVGAALSGGTTTLGAVAGVVDAGSATSFEVPNGAAPTVDAFGEIAGDNDLWAASRGAPVFYDGTAAVALIGVLVSDAPANGEVPQWNTGGTITWEAAGSGDVTAVGDCTTGACFDGTAGTVLTFNNAGGDGTLTYDGTYFVFEDKAIAGGSTANDDLAIHGTTNVTRTTSYVQIQPSGGKTIVGGTATTEDEDFMILGDAFGVENDSTGNTGLVIRRDGGTAVRWFVYTPGNSTDLRFYDGADKVTLRADGTVSTSAGYRIAGVQNISATDPTIASGFGTTPSVNSANGTAAFLVNVGTGGTASSGVLTMTGASTGHICHVENRTGVAANRADQRTVQTATTTTSVTVQNQTISTGAALAWTASDILEFACTMY